MLTKDTVNEFIDKNFCRLGYATFLINEKFLYVETPKVASTTMKYILSDLLGSMNPEEILVGVETTMPMSIHYKEKHGIPNILDYQIDDRCSILTSNDIIRFCIVRNPYARIVSAWSDKILQGEPSFYKIIEKIKCDLCIENTYPTFENFVDWLFVNKENVEMDPHFNKMSNLLYFDSIMYTDIVKLENFENDLYCLFKKSGMSIDLKSALDKFSYNESLALDWTTCYTDSIASKVYSIYEEDFKFLNYKYDSWKKRTNKKLDICELRNSALKQIRERNKTIQHLKEEINSLKKVKS